MFPFANRPVGSSPSKHPFDDGQHDVNHPAVDIDGINDSVVTDATPPQVRRSQTTSNRHCGCQSNALSQRNFGDVTSRKVLDHLGVKRAKELVVAVNDPDASLRAVRQARSLSKEVRILVRTSYLDDAAVLFRAGASRVVSADVESAIEIVQMILGGHGTDSATVERQLNRIRALRAEVS